MAFFRTRKTAGTSTQVKTAGPSTPPPTAEAVPRPRNFSGKNKNRLSLLFKKPFVPAEAPSVVESTPAPDHRSAVRSSLDACSTCVTSDASLKAETPPPARISDSTGEKSTATETATAPRADAAIRRASRASLQIRPLPPLPGKESSAAVGLGLVNAPTSSDSHETSSDEHHAGFSKVSVRRPSLPVTAKPATRVSAARADRPQSFCGLPPSARRYTPAQLPVSTACHEGMTAASSVGHPLPLEDGGLSPATARPRIAGKQPDRPTTVASAEGVIGRQRIAQFRAGWSSMSAASGETARLARPMEPTGRFATRSTSMIEFAATDKAKGLSHRRVSSGTLAYQMNGGDSRRSSTASSLKPLALESAASHPSLKQLMKTKPIPPPPRPARSSARYCLRPTRDFSTQTPAEWDVPSSSRSSMIGRPRNHRRGSSWGIPAQLAPGSLSPTSGVAPTLPAVPAQDSPLPSRYGVPSPSIYSVASFDTAVRATRASRGAGSLAFEDLSQIAEASSPPLPSKSFEMGSPGALAFDSPFVNYSMRLSPVTEAIRTPLVGSQAPISPFRSITPPPALADVAICAVADDMRPTRTSLTVVVPTPTDPLLDDGDSSNPQSPASSNSSEKSCATDSPATSSAESDCSTSADLKKADSPFDLTTQVPLAVVALPILDSMTPTERPFARPTRDLAVSPEQLQARRFSEADQPIPRLRNAEAIGAAERAAKGRSFFLVQALLGEAPTDGLVRDWAKNVYSEDETSDEESLLGQPTSEESDLEEE